jgi:hypothetical protein
MQPYVRRLLESGIAVQIEAPATGTVPDADVVPHPWYDCGAVMDWSRQRLVPAGCSPLLETSQMASDVSSFFEPLSDAQVERDAFLTVLEIDSAMGLGPLVAEAQNKSLFCIRSSGSSAEPAAWFKFVKGSQGQRSARDTAVTIIKSIGAQLQRSGLRVLVVFSSLVILTVSGFDDALRNTGAVYRALTAQKIKINGALSMLDPRRPCYFSHSYTNTLVPSVFLTAGEGVRDRLVRAVVDAFYQMLQDKYEWLLGGYLPPRESSVVAAFATFVSECLWPNMALLASGDGIEGFEDASALCDAARPFLVSRPPQQNQSSGAVFWTPLELRLLLLRINALSLQAQH